MTKQYTRLLETEGVTITFSDDALDEIAKLAADVNSRTENIGARRLHTVMEKLLEEILFEAPRSIERRSTSPPRKYETPSPTLPKTWTLAATSSGSLRAFAHLAGGKSSG